MLAFEVSKILLNNKYKMMKRNLFFLAVALFVLTSNVDAQRRGGGGNSEWKSSGDTEMGVFFGSTSSVIQNTNSSSAPDPEDYGSGFNVGFQYDYFCSRY